MTRRSKRFTPGLEMSETRLLMTAGVAPSSLIHPAALHAAAVPTVRLQGTISGWFSANSANADSSRNFKIGGIGFIRSVGNLGLGGQFRSVGFVMDGQATGTVNLNTTKGSIVLRLTGPSQVGPAGLPGTFTYRVVSATGIYRGVSDTGQAALSMRTTMGSKGLGSIGRFSLSFKSDALTA